MSPFILGAAAVLATAWIAHLGSAAVTFFHCARPPRLLRRNGSFSKDAARNRDAHVPVSLIRPVAGLPEEEMEALRSTLGVTYPALEVIFCAATPDDPAIPFIESLSGNEIGRIARVLVGRDLATSNPKLDNLEKAWRGAAHDLIVIADSNVALPPDCIEQLLADWDEETGTVCSPPIGRHAETLAADIEAAFFNTYQARWLITVAALGQGFIHGKVMMTRRSTIERLGGLAALRGDIAEDAAATKLMWNAGLPIRIVQRPFAQRLGRRTIGEVWSRQLRWAKMRRCAYPRFFWIELLSTTWVPVLSVLALSGAAGWNIGVAVPALLACWYGVEAALAKLVDWPVGRNFLAACLCRDLCMIAIVVFACLRQTYIWRGHRIDVRRSTPGDPL